ncbi:MAG: aldose 1-epimerase family protein [Propionibacteriaceae bacterium]
MTTNPTGDQYEITFQEQRAVITEVGATLRVYSVDGRDVVSGFAEDEVVHGGRGMQLLPWPNRIRDGVYTFNGVEQQLALTEPKRHNAIHGLVRHVVWDLMDFTGDSVTQRVRVYPQPGWPSTLEASITHTLSSDGLEVKVSATNIGSEPVPFGYAAHPYFTVGEDVVDDIVLQLPAKSYLEVDDRLLPVEIKRVKGTEQDFRKPHPLGSVGLDTAFTDLIRDDDGRARVKLSLGDRYAEMWCDETMGWLQVFTGDDRRDINLAVEPMTCGPDAFNAGPTDADVVVLAPGASFTGRWGVVGR